MEFVRLVLELAGGLYDEWFEGSVDRGRRKQAGGHFGRGRELLKKGLYQQAETEFRCALYYHPDKSDLLVAVDELRQASLENPGIDSLRELYRKVSRELGRNKGLESVGAAQTSPHSG